VLSGKAFRKPAFALEYKGIVYAVSRWTSPKRTRSFPYARVYDTINCTPRVTVIPFCKDEGRDGDRDFVQWDSVSLMSLLGVYVVLAYYKTARKSPRYKNKITGQELDYDYVLSRFDELRESLRDRLKLAFADIGNPNDFGQLSAITMEHRLNGPFVAFQTRL